MSEVVLDEEEAKALRENASSLILGGGSGEFQPLSCRYCLAIIEEYNRCLMEHQIPQSPS